jgi:hypothetical protein
MHTHETPESESEVLGERVEWQVVSWALWVMVWGAELGAGGGEGAASGDLAGDWGSTESGAGKHLFRVSQMFEMNW